MKHTAVSLISLVILMMSALHTDAQQTIRVDDFEDGNDDGWLTSSDQLVFDASEYSYKLHSAEPLDRKQAKASEYFAMICGRRGWRTTLSLASVRSSLRHVK